MNDQPPMTATAQAAGLDVLRGVLRRHNPGFDAIFEIEGTDLVDDPASGEIKGSLSKPEDPHPALDRVDVPTTTSRAANEDAVNESGEYLAPIGHREV